MARTAAGAARTFTTYAVESLRRIYESDSDAFAQAKRRFGGWDVDSVIKAVLPHITVEIDDHGLPIFSVPAPKRKRSNEY